MNKKTLYVAYGSNLNVPQMIRRCPDAKVFGVGKIKNYRLEFKALGEFAYATIAPDDGQYVPVVVWEISVSDEKRLDIYEGFPTHYYKERIWVTLENGRVEAMVYIMNKKAHYMSPSKQYFNVVMEGYCRFGLDEEKLYEAIRLSKNL